MRTLLIVLALVIIAFVCGTTADAQRWRRHEAPFTPAWANPQLDVFPTVGPPGTEVQIRGARFHEGVEVFYGNRPMQIVEEGDRYLFAVIPPGVGGEDFIYVVDRTGRARTAVPFAIEPAPDYRPLWPPRF